MGFITVRGFSLAVRRGASKHMTTHAPHTHPHAHTHTYSHMQTERECERERETDRDLRDRQRLERLTD